MEDISAKIGEILRSPEQLQNLQNLASMLGLGGGVNPPASPSGPPPSADGPEALSALLQSQSQSSENSLFGSLDPAMISSLIGLVNKAGRMEKEDKGIALLRALKPLLSEERSRRVDDAARLLILARMLPMLKDAGILSIGNL